MGLPFGFGVLMTFRIATLEDGEEYPDEILNDFLTRVYMDRTSGSIIL